MIKAGQDTLASDLVFTTTAGEALTALDPVYISTSDGKAYKCDGNDTAKLRFAGFAQEGASLNAAVNVVTPGNILGGFSSLTAGAIYFLSDTAGSISTTPGTYEVSIGRALTSTTMQIEKGSGYMSGTTSFSSTTTTTITTGFKVRNVRIRAQDSGGVGNSVGGYTVKGGNGCVYYKAAASPAGNVDATKAWNIGDGSSATLHSGVVDTIDDTSFRLNNTESAGTSVCNIYWEAEGDF